VRCRCHWHSRVRTVSRRPRGEARRAVSRSPCCAALLSGCRVRTPALVLLRPALLSLLRAAIRIERPRHFAWLTSTHA
jgi:hypothetical protein